VGLQSLGTLLVASQLLWRVRLLSSSDCPLRPTLASWLASRLATSLGIKRRALLPSISPVLRKPDTYSCSHVMAGGRI